jgi:hypothetical protein
MANVVNPNLLIFGGPTADSFQVHNANLKDVLWPIKLFKSVNSKQLSSPTPFLPSIPPICSEVGLSASAFSIRVLLASTEQRTSSSQDLPAHNAE